jgi:uncharacterized cofD-like protein
MGMRVVKKNGFQRLTNNFRSKLRWFVPGIHVKRWVGLILIGTTLLGIGIAVLILDIYRTAPETWWLPILSTLSLRFLDRTLRAIIFGGIGFSFLILGIWGLNQSLLRPFLHPGKNILDAVSSYRLKEKGLKIVVIGGGNGLSSLLRGLKAFTHNLTAIVTVADDGGSSGKLREKIGILPPGDIRNCLAALSNDEALLTQIFQYRFSEELGLDGHSLGNLFITALTGITGSFEEAVAESGRVLAVQGKVLPSTLHDVRLVAEVSVPQSPGGIQINGESKIPKTNGSVQKVWLEPTNPLAFPPAIQAILSADLIVIGPGSLYTSILPNLLVPNLADAIRVSRAGKFYVCNVATQVGETDKYSCGDHVRTIEQHLGGSIFDVIICNKNFDFELPDGPEWVKPEKDFEENYSCYFADLANKDNPWRHDDKKLARVVIDLFYERTGPLMAKEDQQTTKPFNTINNKISI